MNFSPLLLLFASQHEDHTRWLGPLLGRRRINAKNDY